MINRPTEVIVHGEYIPRGQFDEELDVRDFYFTPEQIHMVMEILHDRVMSDLEVVDSEENDLLQELTIQVLHHPDNDKSVVQTTLTNALRSVILQV